MYKHHNYRTMRNYKNNLRFVLFLVAIALVNGSCDKEEPVPSTFGMEEGDYWWVDNDEKQWLKRDRDRLSIRFYEDYGRAFHDSILDAYGIQTVWAQPFDKLPPMSGLYRVTKNPAEEYYTSYGDTTLNRLGNLPEVEYVLPVFFANDDSWGLMIMPEIFYTFHDSITDTRKSEIMDSLMANDNIVLRQQTHGEEMSPYHIYVTKSSPACPYTLYQRYYETGIFESINLNYVSLLNTVSPNKSGSIKPQSLH